MATRKGQAEGPPRRPPKSRGGSGHPTRSHPPSWGRSPGTVKTEHLSWPCRTLPSLCTCEVGEEERQEARVSWSDSLAEDSLECAGERKWGGGCRPSLRTPGPPPGWLGVGGAAWTVAVSAPLTELRPQTPEPQPGWLSGPCQAQAGDWRGCGAFLAPAPTQPAPSIWSGLAAPKTVAHSRDRR